MALEDTTGGLPSDEPQIKATMPKAGGLSLAGQKGVSLNPADSADIRDRLMQMIQQREQAASGWGPIMEQAAVSAGGPGTFATNLQNYNTNQRNKESELFNMRVGLAQLNTEDARIKQAQQEKAQNDAMFFSLLGVKPPQAGAAPVAGPQGGAAPVAGPQVGAAPIAGPQGGAAPIAGPQGGAAPVAGPQAGAAPVSNVGQEPMAEIFALYRQDPKAAINKLIEMRKVDDVQKRLIAAGVQPGSDQWNTALFSNVAGASAFIPHDVRGPGGTTQQTPFSAAGAVMGNKPPAAPAPMAATQGAPIVTAPAPMAASVPAATSMGAVPAPAQGGTLSPSSKEGLELQKERESIPIAAAKQEALKVAETAAKEQEQHSADVKEAQNNSMIAQSMQKDIRKADSLLGKLAGGGAQSAFFGLIDGGIQVGQLGSVNLPRFTEAVVKMDPKAKDPAVMDAYVRVAQNVEGLKLAYTRKVFQGQGSVTENERKLISTAVGDVNHMSPANLMRMAKATELEARNKMDQDRLWTQMKDAGVSWNQFKSSPELKEMQRQQFYRTAKAFRIDNAVYPGDEQR